MDQPHIVSVNPDGTPRVMFFTSLDQFNAHFDKGLSDPIPVVVPPVVEVNDKPPGLPEAAPPVAPVARVHPKPRATKRVSELSPEDRERLGLNRGCGCSGGSRPPANPK